MSELRDLSFFVRILGWLVDNGRCLGEHWWRLEIDPGRVGSTAALFHATVLPTILGVL